MNSRGGSYWNDASNCRSAHRNNNDPSNRNDNNGLRVCLPASSSSLREHNDEN